MMLGTLVKETSGLLDRRFLINSFLPMLGFGAIVTFVAIDCGLGVHASTAWWRHIGAVGQVVVTLGAFGVTCLFAALLSVLQTSVLGWYEGDWHSRAGMFWADWGKSWHANYFNRLASLSRRDPSAYHRIYVTYPLPPQSELVMPTTLGNILLNAQLHAWDRYGIPTALVWPRLFPLLPDRMIQALDGARADLELMVNLSFLATLSGCIAAVITFSSGAEWWLFSVCLGGGALVALLAYRGAIAAARVYGQQVKVAFDMFRGVIVQHLGITQRLDASLEGATGVIVGPEAWQELALHWYRATPGAVEEPIESEPLTPSKYAVLPLSAVAALAALALSFLGAALLA